MGYPTSGLGGNNAPLALERRSSKNYLTVDLSYIGAKFCRSFYILRARADQRAHYSKYLNEVYKDL